MCEGLVTKPRTIDSGSARAAAGNASQPADSTLRYARPSPKPIHKESDTWPFGMPAQAAAAARYTHGWDRWRATHGGLIANALLPLPVPVPAEAPAAADAAEVMSTRSSIRRELAWPASHRRPQWARPLRRSPGPTSVLGGQVGLSVPCSQLEPLCAGVRGMTQRLLELRLHIARVGQAVSAAGGSHLRESGPPQSRGAGRLPSGHGADRDRDVWFGAQSEWSPLAPRLWSGPADRFHFDDHSLKPLGAQDLRGALASSLALNEDMHQGAAIEALRLGDDWLLYWRQMSDRFSLWFDGRIDVEPRVLFMPQAGVTSRGRAWARGAQLVSVGCEPFDPFNSMEPFPVAPSTNDELYEHTKKVEDLVRSRGSEHGALVAIGQVGCIGPAHMILECLPRLLAARQLTARTPGTVLLTAQSNNLSHAILEAAGIDATVPSTIGKAAAALVVLPENTHCMQPSIGQLLLLRRFISAGLQQCPSPLLAA